MEHNVIDSIDLEVDAIYHLASPASPIHYQSNPIYTTKTIFLGTLNMLELACNYHIPILIASTSEVYGDPLISPQTESYWGNVNPIGIRSCYDEGKRISESLAFDFHRFKNAKIKVVRIFNTFGPEMNANDGRVVSNFINQALKNEDITIYGTGAQTRSFCYIDDLVEGLIKMMEHDNKFIGPVNLGNNYEISILEFAKQVIKITNSKSKLIFNKLPADDPKQRRPDISLASKVLKWQPHTDLNVGLKLTMEYFQKILN